MAFGEGGHFRRLQDGQSLIINLNIIPNEENSASFPLNIVLAIFRYLDTMNLPYVIVSMERRIN